MRPRVVWSDFYYHVKMHFRSPSTFFWSLMFPIMFMFLFGAIFSNSDEITLTLYVQDEDDSVASAQFISALDAPFKIKTIPNGTDVSTYMKDKKISSAVVIPEGFQTEVMRTQAFSMRSQEQFNATPYAAMMNYTAFKALGMAGPGNTSVSLYLDPSQQSTNGAVRSIVMGMAQGWNMQITETPVTIGYVEQTAFSNDYRFIDFFMPGVIGMTLMQSGIYGAVMRNVKYRQMGLLRKLSTTPLRRSEFILAKMLFIVFLGFISTALIMTVGILAFNVAVSVTIWMFLIIIATSFAFAGMGMLISQYVKEEESADSAAGVITFPQMFLAGTFIPLASMPVFLQTFAKFLPLYYVNEGLRDSMILNDAAGTLYNAGIVFVLAIVFFSIGVAVTSWKED